MNFLKILIFGFACSQLAIAQYPTIPSDVELQAEAFMAEVSRYNIINNYFKPGPVTPMNEPIAYRIIKPEGHRGYQDSLILGRAYVGGNIVEGIEKVTRNNWDGGVQVDGNPSATKDYEQNLRMEEPFPLAPIIIMSAEKAYNFVLNNVGATLPQHDPVDKRIVEGENRKTSGKIKRQRSSGQRI